MRNRVTKFFTAREKSRRHRKSINNMEIDSSLCEDPSIIGDHVYNSYKKIFNQKDPYKVGDVQRFLGDEGIKQMGKINPAMKEMIETDFSFLK